MKDKSKTKQGLLEEINILKQRIKQLEQSELAHKRTEEALRESEEKYRRLYESSPAAIYRVNFRTGKFLDANHIFCENFGCSREEITSHSPYDLLTDESKQLLLERLNKIFLGIKVTETPEYEVINKNGVHMWFQLSSKNIHDSEGVMGADVVAHDITERKLAELALRESENKFRSFAENALVGIYLIQGNFLKYVNPKFAEIFGYTVEECLNNMHFRQLVYPEDFDTVQEQIRKRELGDIQSAHYTFRGIKKTGEIIHCEIYGSSIMFDERYTATGTILDITYRIRAEEELRASRQRLRSLAGRIEQVREEERVIISREIHDVMGGGLTGLKMDLSWLMHKVKKAESDNGQAAMIDRILSSSETVDQMIKVTRRISTELRPPVLDDLGLIAALEWQLSEFTGRTGILHQFNTAFEYAVLESDQVIAVFRIFQETLTNIARHSGATKVVVILREDGRNLSGDENLV
ncbi:MAG: PAS domain S-box protein, partial [bacterium]